MAVYTTIDKPTDYFETILWSSVDTSITGLDFQPDWVWIKSRTNADTQVLFDSVRGTGKRLSSSGTTEEQTKTDELTAFNSDGFTIGTGDNVNRSGHNNVAWNWKAGTSFSNDASSTGIGTIDSTGSVNETAGFSIVSYTSTGSVGTVKHGLSTAPQWILFKRRSGDTENWPNFHQAIGATHQVYLNATDAQSDSDTRFNDVAPTSSVFTLGTSGDTNGGTSPFICYCFSERQGYSKFGSYKGNGNADGTYIHLGFKPAWFMIKRTDSADGWLIGDNKRIGYNGGNYWLEANVNDNEDGGSPDRVDFLSNGFKLRNSWSKINASGGTYIYMCFAENPFVTSTGIPTTAR